MIKKFEKFLRYNFKNKIELTNKDERELILKIWIFFIIIKFFTYIEFKKEKLAHNIIY